MFSELTAYQKNAWPAMVADLAAELGVSAKSLTAIGVGWIPVEDCWVFPERGPEGDVVGLVRRFRTGKKLCVEGSKRGLTFAISPTYHPTNQAYVPGSHNWTRVSATCPCPVCHKTDWCLVSVENPEDPQAVICGRKAEGAFQALGDAGFLHIRKEEGRIVHGSGSLLASSERPVLVVEGQSDVCAGMDLGFVVVGKPSAAGGLDMLAELLVGRTVVVLGENDAGAGRKGMERTFETLKPRVASVVKLMPPDTVKDLRAWVRQGLTTNGLLEAITKGETQSDEDILESTAPMDIAERWLHERHWEGDLPLLRLYAGSWYRFDGTKYAKVDDKTYLRGDLYTFLKGKLHRRFNSKGEASVEPYEAEAYKVTNIIDTLTMTCPVYTDAPFWFVDREDNPGITNTIAFANGLLDTSTLTLAPPTPEFFSLTGIPYSWNPGAKCPRWFRFLHEIFPQDPERIALLQEWFGYNMVADTSQEKIMFFVGRPGAGKGTVIEALRATLGAVQIASTSFDTLVGDFGLQPLLGKLAAIMPDAHITRRGDPSKALQILKEISGCDGVSINRKHKEFLSDHKLTCRFTISVNSMPELPDHERSLDRRLLLLPFNECFTGHEDTTLKKTLSEEAPGIAVWAIDGLARLRRSGFTIPRAATDAVEDFRKQSSPISEFAGENCEFDAILQFPSQMLYEAYVRWCKDQGITAGTHARFAHRFTLLHPGCRRGRMSYNGSQMRCLHGTSLTSAAIDRYLVGRT